MTIRFHLAFPVHDLAETRRFYMDLLRCHEGRCAKRWVDFDFWGHQITAHLVAKREAAPTNTIDGNEVPTRHFGAILPWDEWHRMRDHLIAAGVAFRIPPRIRFQGKVGEQATMFFDDPSGNVLELKSFRDANAIFATGDQPDPS